MFAFLRSKAPEIETELSDALLEEAIGYARFPRELKGELLRRARADGVYFTLEYFGPLFRAAYRGPGSDQDKYEALMRSLGCRSARATTPPQLADRLSRSGGAADSLLAGEPVSGPAGRVLI